MYFFMYLFFNGGYQSEVYNFFFSRQGFTGAPAAADGEEFYKFKEQNNIWKYLVEQYNFCFFILARDNVSKILQLFVIALNSCFVHLSGNGPEIAL